MRGIKEHSQVKVVESELHQLAEGEEGQLQVLPPPVLAHSAGLEPLCQRRLQH